MFDKESKSDKFMDAYSLSYLADSQQKFLFLFFKKAEQNLKTMVRWTLTINAWNV